MKPMCLGRTAFSGVLRRVGLQAKWFRELGSIRVHPSEFLSFLFPFFFLEHSQGRHLQYWVPSCGLFDLDFSESQ